MLSSDQHLFLFLLSPPRTNLPSTSTINHIPGQAVALNPMQLRGLDSAFFFSPLAAQPPVVHVTRILTRGESLAWSFATHHQRHCVLMARLIVVSEYFQMKRPISSTYVR